MGATRPWPACNSKRAILSLKQFCLFLDPGDLVPEVKIVDVHARAVKTESGLGREAKTVRNDDRAAAASIVEVVRSRGVQTEATSVLTPEVRTRTL